MNLNENSNSNAKETKEISWVDPDTPHLSCMVDMGVNDPTQRLDSAANGQDYQEQRS